MTDDDSCYFCDKEPTGHMICSRHRAEVDRVLNVLRHYIMERGYATAVATASRAVHVTHVFKLDFDSARITRILDMLRNTDGIHTIEYSKQASEDYRVHDLFIYRKSG